MSISLLEDLGMYYLSGGIEYFFHGKLKDSLGFVQESGVFDSKPEESV
jgi:hypothetical protein